MSLYIRFIITLIKGFFNRQLLGPLDESTITFRVLPNDLDLNGHMNNGRYLTIMDLGRINLIHKMGLLRIVVQRHWFPVVTAVTTSFYRPLKLFQTYRLKSRVICWDEKYFFVEQQFERNGKLIATGIVKVLIRSRAGNVQTEQVINAMGSDVISPNIPLAIEAWQRSESLTVAETVLR
ncbi:MAG: acyl-CoA thioesterase [Acidobacteriota bacterium]